MNKYQRIISGVPVGIDSALAIDIYDIIAAYRVTCPATAHALKKLLMPGERGAKSAEQDLREAIQAIERAIQLLPKEPANG